MKVIFFLVFGLLFQDDNFFAIDFDHMEEVASYFKGDLPVADIENILRDITAQEQQYVKEHFRREIDIDLLFEVNGIYYAYRTCDGFLKENYNLNAYHENIISKSIKCIPVRSWNPNLVYNKSTSRVHRYNDITLHHFLFYRE